MEWFQDWINQIVLAVILCVLIELILPENASKKYVKTVIEIYLVFAVFSPIAGFFQKEGWADFSLENILLEQGKTRQTSSGLSSDSIAEVYEKELEKNIRDQLNEKGYLAGDITIQMKQDGTYTLTEIKITELEKKEVKLEGMPVSKGEENVLKEQISEEYGVAKEKITLERKER